MANGFEVYASDGSLLINNNMIGWFCKKTGRGTTVARAGTGNSSPSKISVGTGGGTGTVYPMVAIRMDNEYAVARCGTPWGTTIQQYISDAPIGTGYNYYIFDYAPTLPSVNMGIETYTDSGEISFNSAYWPFKPVANIRNGAVYSPNHYLAICGPSPGGYRGTPSYVNYYSGGSQVPEETDYDQYSYMNNCKLTGGKIVGPDYGVPVDVSFDDVVIGPRDGIYTPPSTWSTSAPVLTVDVAWIPDNTTFF